jgi:hypothetical protein
MGYNLLAGCHTCRVVCYALRGDEARVIGWFASQHPKPHRREVLVDNGWSSPDCFPAVYRSVYDDYEKAIS